jgi:hypothetical protein
MRVISPLVAKSRSSWLAGARLPLPDTVDCTTPRATVTVRSCALDVGGEPTTTIATTIAAIASAARTIVVGAGLRSFRRPISWRWCRSASRPAAAVAGRSVRGSAA